MNKIEIKNIIILHLILSVDTNRAQSFFKNIRCDI